MAKSKLIKELANSSIDTATALKRLKILLMSFNKPDLDEWVNCELNGYSSDKIFPYYRCFNTLIYADFYRGNFQFINTLIPIQSIPEDIRNIFAVNLYGDGIASIEEMHGKNLCKIVPPEFYKSLKKCINADYISSVRIIDTYSASKQIINIVQSKIFDVLCILENEFGILDELDIDCTDKSEQEINEVYQKIYNIIYIDKGINIGNDNKIVKSNICTE